jgi:hypothetical protein
MELRVEMRSADTNMDVDGPTDPVWVQLRAPEVRPPKRKVWQQKWTATNAGFDRVFLTSDFGHERNICGSSIKSTTPIVNIAAMLIK